MKKFTQKNADLGDAVEMGLLAEEYDKICEIRVQLHRIVFSLLCGQNTVLIKIQLPG